MTRPHVRHRVTALAVFFTLVPLAVTSRAATPGTKLWRAPNVTGGTEVVVSPDGEVVYAVGPVVVAHDAVSGVPNWEAPTLEGDAEANLRSVTLSPDGTTVFAAGELHEDATGTRVHFFVVALDAITGTIEWSKTWGESVQIMNRIVVGPHGRRVFVTGWTAAHNYVTVSLRADDGARRWLRRYDGPEHGIDTPQALAITPNGATLIVSGGSHQGTVRDQEFVTIAYDTTSGERRWLRRFGGGVQGATDAAFDIAIDPEGERVFVTGVVHTGTADAEAPLDIGVVAYDVSTGETEWSRYLGPPGTNDTGWSVAVSPEGDGIFIAARLADDLGTVALDAEGGSRRWVRHHDGPAGWFDTGYGVTVTPDGTEVVVVGEVCSGLQADCIDGSGLDYQTIVYGAASGDRHWLRRAGELRIRRPRRGRSRSDRTDRPRS